MKRKIEEITTLMQLGYKMVMEKGVFIWSLAPDEETSLSKKQNKTKKRIEKERKKEKKIKLWSKGLVAAF